MIANMTWLLCTILTGEKKLFDFLCYPSLERLCGIYSVKFTDEYRLEANLSSIYRYTYGINWRAVTAFIVGVAPNLPGFINSINPKVNVGVGSRPYTFAWLLGFTITSVIYLLLSTVFPPKESMIPRAILPDEVYESHDTGDMIIEGKGSDSDDLERHGTGKGDWKKEENELRVT